MPGDNIHPMTGPGSGAMNLLKSNPFGAFLAAMFLLALIVSPRKRKYKPKRKYVRRRKSRKSGNPCKKNPGNPGKKKKARKAKKSAKIRIRKRTPGPRHTSKGQLPAWRIKGSPEAIARMKKLRGMRKK